MIDADTLLLQQVYQKKSILANFLSFQLHPTTAITHAKLIPFIPTFD